MESEFRDGFIRSWRKYFNDSELPITFYYTDDSGRAEVAEKGKIPQCIVGALIEVRKGRSLSFDGRSIACFGGRKYLGYTEKDPPDFEYFLSCGIPGKVEGERYKKSPEIVRSWAASHPKFKAPARYAVFKRWDKLEEEDDPQVIVFFAKPDVLSGLFTLANFEETDPNGVIAPMGSGCSVIIQQPFLEGRSGTPRAVVGMFDVSARTSVDENTLSFSVPMSKFRRMVGNMEESFLITESWREVQNRI